MSGITLKNPVVNSVPTAIAIGRKGVDDNGKSLSTGLKADNDVVSTFLGQGLGDKAKILTKVLGNMGYSSNALRITQDSLGSIAATLGDMLSVIAQNGGSKAATRTLDDILQQKIATVAQQIKSAEFDGRKLLTGDLGSDPTVRTKFNTKIVDVRSGIPAAGNFAGPAVAGVSSVNITNNANIATGAGGDSITVGTITFKFVEASPDYTKNQILKGANEAETAQNIATSIRNNQDESIRGYFVDVLGQSVVIGQRSAGSTASVGLVVTSAGVAMAQALPSSQSLIFAGAATAADTVTIAGVVFTFRATGQPANTYGPQDVDLGANQGGSGTNLLAKIVAHPVTADLIARGLLDVTTTGNAGADLLIQSAGGATMIGLASSRPGNAPIAVVVGSAAFTASTGAIDVSGISKVEGFINSVTPTFTVTDYALTNAPAVALYTQLTGGGPVGAPAGNGGDATIAMTATMAGRSFQAVIFKPNGNFAAGTLIKFTEKSTGESFTVKAGAAWGPDVTTKVNAQTNVANAITTLFTNAVFAQTRDLTINTDAGDIVVGGASVGSVEGMTVSLNSTSFTDKKFESFVITAATNAVPGSVKFTATISGINYVADNVAAANLVKGTALLLKQADGNDLLTINIGEKGLTKLRDVANYAPISEAIKAALTSSGSGLDVRVGLSFDDVLKVKVPDVSATKLYRDNAGIFQEKLTVLDQAGAKKAQEVVTNALNEVRAAQAIVQGQSETVAAASTSLSSAIGVTKDASAGYLDTDLVQAASAFAASLKSILAAISTLQAGARVADAGLEIIKSAAQ